jgi:hypothetical protein
MPYPVGYPLDCHSMNMRDPSQDQTFERVFILSADARKQRRKITLF